MTPSEIALFLTKARLWIVRGFAKRYRLFCGLRLLSIPLALLAIFFMIGRLPLPGTIFLIISFILLIAPPIMQWTARKFKNKANRDLLRNEEYIKCQQELNTAKPEEKDKIVKRIAQLKRADKDLLYGKIIHFTIIILLVIICAILINYLLDQAIRGLMSLRN